MKNTTYMALALLASATFNTALAGKKKDVVQVATVAPVELKTSSDSVSYVAGMAATKGLIPFVQQQYKVDTTYHLWQKVQIDGFTALDKARQAQSCRT